MFGIYKIVNKINGKYYLGSTTDYFCQRFANHKSELRLNKHPNPKLQRSWNKYGEDSFDFLVVEELTDKARVLEVEQKYIDSNFGNPLCLNMRPSVSSSAGRIVSVREKMKISNSKCNKVYTFKSPNGEETRIINLVEFAKSNSLDFSAMYKVAKGQNSHHKKWTILKVEDRV